MILLINTVDNKPYVALAKKSELLSVELLKGEGAKKSEDLTPAIQRIFKKNKIKTSNLELVAAVPGPGSFSASRAGVAVANALGYSLNVKTLGISHKKAATPDDFLQTVITSLSKAKKGDIISPIYNSQPNITVK